MKTAVIFAAGRGERMKPLSRQIPKALSIVHGAPLIEHHLRRLATAGFERVVINHAYLGGKIRQCLGFGERFGLDICYSPEPPGALESGGGLVNALPLLGDAPFITLNADILTDYPFAALKPPRDKHAHLVIVRTSPGNKADFGLSATGELMNSDCTHTFAGIACYHPQSLKHLKPGRYSIVPELRRWIAQGKVSCEVYTGTWRNIETPQQWQEVCQLAVTANASSPGSI
jgi:MurNAc alpha-1-phosphate uridylyltransferase